MPSLEGLTLVNAGPTNDTYIDDLDTTNIDMLHTVNVDGIRYYGLDTDNDGEVDLYAELINNDQHYDLRDADGNLHLSPPLYDVEFWVGKETEKENLQNSLGEITNGSSKEFGEMVNKGTVAALFKLWELFAAAQ